MGNRTTVYNKITSPEKLSQVHPKNIELGKDFLDYLTSIDRSKRTIASYENDILIFWCWNLDYNNNKFFPELTKREVAKFQNHAMNIWGWSPNRVRRVKSTLSSMSNYIENILDDEPEFRDYRPIIKKIENPVKKEVRDKTVFTEDQLNSLLQKLVDGEKYAQACMLSLAMNNGRRKSELPRMKTSYFTDDNIIYGSLYKSPECVVTKGRGSTGNPLIVFTLSKPFRPYLDLWLQYREEHGITSQWLIPRTVNGKYVDEPVPITTMDSWAEAFTKLLGVPFYWHSLRHYFTTACSKSGLPDDVIRMLVGWESNDMVTLYKDISIDEEFGKYFGEDGIKQVELKSIADI